jgi:hypothetical protein
LLDDPPAKTFARGRLPLYQRRPRKVALAAFKTFAVEALTTFDVSRTEADPQLTGKYAN